MAYLFLAANVFLTDLGVSMLEEVAIGLTALPQNSFFLRPGKDIYPT